MQHRPAPRAELVLVLTAGRRIEGRIVFPEGRDGAKWAIVVSRGEEETQSVSGVTAGFRFEALAPGVWSIGVHREDWGPSNIPSLRSGEVSEGAVFEVELDLPDVLPEPAIPPGSIPRRTDR